MSDIYITGHQNPDLDSVCSAYGYAVLKNLIDKENNYIPVRCGHLSNSTKSILPEGCLYSCSKKDNGKSGVFTFVL